MRLSAILLRCFCLLLPIVVLPQKKLAMVVAIADYADANNWPRLASLNDLHYIRGALTRFGFSEKNISVLKNEKATKKEILEQLDALAAKAEQGDIVVFYFCGHGQQIMDDNDDEADGYDEALIPYDAKAKYDPKPLAYGGYQGQNHLRDDELGMKLDKIRNRIGNQGDLLVMLDACHSGTGTRTKSESFTVYRGSPHPFKSGEYRPANRIAIGGNALQHKGFSEPDTSVAGNMVVISASGPNQLNHQTRDDRGVGVGSLSYAFARALNEMKPDDDYYLLFEKIKARIQAYFPTQLPMMEGNSARRLFSGQFSAREEAITITRANWINDTAFYFDRGYLHDIATGSTFTLFVVGKEEVSAPGYVAKTEALQSLGVVSKKMDKRNGYELKPDGVNFGNFSASLFINDHGLNTPRTRAVGNQLKELIKSHGFLSLNRDADLMLDIATGENGDTVNLIEKIDSVRWTRRLVGGDLLSASDKDELIRNIRASIRINYLRNLKDGGTLADQVKVEILPGADKTDSLTRELVLGNGDLFSIKISNKGPRHLYYTIIDIMPDNTIKVLLPNSSIRAADCQLLPKQEYTTGKLVVSARTPRGKEFFKFIFSESPMDLTGVINRLKTQRASMQSFEKVFDDMFNDDDKGKRNISNIEIDRIGILTTGYTIE